MNKLSLKNFSIAITGIFLIMIAVASLVPVFAQADGAGSSNCQTGQLCNPIGSGTLDDFLKKVVSAAVRIGVPIAALFIIWAGFKFVTARGDEKAIKDAKQIFWYTIIGTFILLAASVIVEVLSTTVLEVGGGAR